MTAAAEREVSSGLRRGRLVTTAGMTAAFLTMGLLFGVISPATVDLVILRDINYEEFSRATTCRAVGVLVGAFLGALISDRFREKTNHYISTGCLVAGISSIALPWIPSLALMGLMWALQGLMYGSINVLSSSVVMAIWDSDTASTALSAIHAAYPLGILLAPPIVAPFLGSSNQTVLPDDGDSFDRANATTSGESEEADDVLPVLPLDVPFDTRIHVPFAIFGIGNIVVTVIFAYFVFRAWSYKDMENKLANERAIYCQVDEQKHDSSVFARSTEACRALPDTSTVQNTPKKWFTVSILAILFLLFVVIIGRDYSLVLYVFAIAVESELNIPKQLAAHINTTYNAGMTAGRITSAILAKYIPIQPLALLQIIAAVVVCALLAMIGLDKLVNFWLLTALHGFFCSPNNPTMMAWANRYIVCSGLSVAVLDAGIGVGGFVGTYISGVIFENYGSQGALSFGLILASCVVVIFVPLQIFARCHGERFVDAKLPEKERGEKSEKLDESTGLLSNSKKKTGWV